MSLYVLFEHAMGYALFTVEQFEEIGSLLPQVEQSVNDLLKFKKIVYLIAFRAFKNAASSLENMNAVSEGLLTDDLTAFLRTNLPLGGKNKVTLGVSDPKLGAAISESFGISINHTGAIPEIVRGIRNHLPNLIKNVNPVSVKQTELGLGHAYSRGKVKFNVNRVDNMIIQSIALVDQLDKDINVFSMRIREWYSYHFPELAKVVTDNYQYVVCANHIKDRTLLSEDHRAKLEEVLGDPDKAQAIYDVARMSMGMDISPIDLLNIEVFAKKVANLSEYRKRLFKYLQDKMNAVAPNLSTLIGEIVGARLISHAGSLTSLAKYPASTVQILGAEKALFRALKTRTNTPKYGLIYHSNFIGRAGSTNKGRISRYLANKCSLASRIDCFSDVLTNVFGTNLKNQVEERLKFYESGDLPRKNVEVMTAAVAENKEVITQMLTKNKKRKRQSLPSEDVATNDSILEQSVGKTPKKKKKNKKAEPQEAEEPEETMDVSQNEVDGSSKKKKKKKKQKELQEASEMPEYADMEMEEEGAVMKKKKKRKSKGAAEEE